MRKLIAIVGLLAISGIVVAQQTRTEVTKATTPADDSKPNSDTVPQVYALGGRFERILVLRFRYEADLLAGLESMVKQHKIRNTVILSGIGSVKGYHVHVASNREFPSKNVFIEDPTAYADHAIEFSRKNAFDIITGHRTDMPMILVSRFFSTPGAGGMALIYAYELTKKPAYLAAAVQGANYSLGANPDNLSYCTGVGDHAQHFNFIVDALVSGQQPDKIVGHIPYGQGNEGNAMSRGMNGWVQTRLLNFGPTKKMVPNWFDWPVTEQYIDFAIYPLHNENGFNQTTVPAACYWFWLNSRR